MGRVTGHSGAQSRIERAVRAGLTRGLGMTRGGETHPLRVVHQRSLGDTEPNPFG